MQTQTQEQTQMQMQTQAFAQAQAQAQTQAQPQSQRHSHSRRHADTEIKAKQLTRPAHTNPSKIFVRSVSPPSRSLNPVMFLGFKTNARFIIYNYLKDITR